MNTRPKTKLLTISLLCCGRPDTTERCLESLMPIRRAVDSEIIVVDTGCDKDTRSIVDKYADQVIEFTWCNDFAKARNTQLEAANGEWFMFLDDDEYFIECQDIIDFFNSDQHLKYGYGGYTVRNFLNFKGTEWADSRNGRMAKVNPKLHFHGKVHERFEGEEGSCIYFKAYVGHFGYVHQTQEDVYRHSMRNIPLLLEMLEEDPADSNIPIQLAQEYMGIKEYDKMLEICQRYLDILERADGDMRKSRGILFVGKLIALENMSRFEDFKATYHYFASEDRVTPIARAEATKLYARRLFLEQDFKGSIEAAEEFLEIDEFYRKNELALFVDMGIFMHNTFDKNSMNDIYCYLMASGIKLEDYSYIKRYLDKVSWEDKHFRLVRGYVVYLLEYGISKEPRPEIVEAFYRFSVQEDLEKALKKEIKESLFEAPPAMLENLKRFFEEGDFGEEISNYISLIENAKNNPGQFNEVYELEGKILTQLEHLDDENSRLEVEAARLQVQGLVGSIYGVKSLH